AAAVSRVGRVRRTEKRLVRSYAGTANSSGARALVRPGASGARTRTTPAAAARRRKLTTRTRTIPVSALGRLRSSVTDTATAASATRASSPTAVEPLGSWEMAD